MSKPSVFLPAATRDAMRASVSMISIAFLLAAVSPCSIALAQTPSAPGQIVACRDIRSDGVVTLYAQCLLATGGVDPIWNPSSSGLCVGAGTQWSFGSVPDGAGGLLLAWVEPNGAGSNLRIQHLESQGELAPGWPEQGRLLCEATGDQYGAHIVGDGAGGAIVCWQDYRSGQGDIYATQVTGSGAVVAGWPANGLAVAADSTEQTGSAIASDGAGGAFVAWQDFQVGASRLAMAHLRGDGTMSEVPLELSGATESQANAQLLSDGEGGVFIAWESRSDQGPCSVIAQHIAASGQRAAGWPASGVAVAQNSGDQRFPVLVRGVSGGVVVAWVDHRETVGTVRMQSLSASSARREGWPADGLAVSSSTAEQYSPALMADGEGTATLAWEDYRNGSAADIYAQRVTPDGALLWGAAGSVVCDAALDQQAPSLRADGNGVVATWTDERTNTRGEWVRPFAASALHLVRISAEGGAVHFEWQTGESVDEAKLYRVEADGALLLVGGGSSRSRKSHSGG